jgi:hypothetical protein
METTIRHQLEIYYQQRAERLETLKLDDILSDSASVFWSPGSESASKVVSRLIEKYLTRFEDWWNTLIQDSEFCMKAISLRTRITAPRFLYEEELAKAHNRITREFLNRFSTPENAVHWSKLLRFNSSTI